MQEVVNEILITVMGVVFQAFIPPGEAQPVYSQKGVAKGLKMAESSVRSLRKSKELNDFLSGRDSDAEKGLEVLPGAGFDERASLKVRSGNSTQTIATVSSAELVAMVDILSKRGNPTAQAMTTTSFALELKRAEDTALGVSRPEEEYQQAGKELLDRVEYLNQYNLLKQAAFEKKLGVPGLSKVNKQVGELAVPDAQERRQTSKAWRKDCTKSEIHKLAIGTIVHQGAIEASANNKELDGHLPEAKNRTLKIYDIVDAPWGPPSP